MGLLTVRRRRLTAAGVQPVGLIQPTFEWFYIYGAVAPTTGDRFFLESPSLNADTFQLFVDAFAQAFPDSFNILSWIIVGPIPRNRFDGLPTCSLYGSRPTVLS